MSAIEDMDTTDAKTDVSEISERTQDGAAKRPWRKALLREIRTHPFGYTVLALFVLAGPLVAPFLFPQASPTVAIVGGLVFGLYAALCAVPQKFL